MNAALWVFHFAVLTFAISVLQVPYTAMIITHEKMNAYAYISIADMLLKLIAVILLPNLSDKLEKSIRTFFIGAIFFLYWLYESSIKFRAQQIVAVCSDKSLIKNHF